MKIGAIVITLLITLGVAVVVFVFMLIAMNGFSEHDANCGIAAFAVLAVLSSAAVSAAAGMLGQSFADRGMRKPLAAALAVAVCAGIGWLLVSASGFAGVAVAEIVRKNL